MSTLHDELLKVIGELEVEKRFKELDKQGYDRLQRAKEMLVAQGPALPFETPVTSFEEFRKKYGTRFPRILIEEFIRNSPEFPGKFERATDLAIMMADLESC